MRWNGQSRPHRAKAKPPMIRKRLTTALLCALGACGSSEAKPSTAPPSGDTQLSSCQPTDTGAMHFERIATWLDDARGAYSLIHDDFCEPRFDGIRAAALPALKRVGLHAGLAAIANDCEQHKRWDWLVEAEDAGHEIVSHSYTHALITADNAEHEIAESKAAFDAKIRHPIEFFAFPYDYFTPETIERARTAGYLGARAGNRNDNDSFNPPLNPAAPEGDYAVEFDVWPRGYSKYVLYYPDDVLNVHAYQAIESGGWSVREFHGVVEQGLDPALGGFGAIDLPSYERHLTFLSNAWKKGVLWTAPPSTVLRYRRARQACSARLTQDTLEFDSSAEECRTYATPLSAIVTTERDVGRIDALQNGRPVAARKLGPRTYSITADPTAGDVTLTGCANPGAELAHDLALPDKPQPAASVCEIERVAGTGAPGRMDDLERPANQLKVLPNPGQADARTGSWSWYPPSAVGAISEDGDNHVLRFSGGNQARWSGIALAFLGGNGAGACYDASAYTGLRFRIRGSVASADDLDGQVVLSLITADTQSRRRGGDLDGEGGHFQTRVEVTADWREVSVAWSDLQPPEWGVTRDRTVFAVDKLQAIDWGISDMASEFAIEIDDIELF